ncbi:helix-turn-helix transcriptional regulator [Leeuwenhoekiella nanhaiensis]|uniref:Helix-turn-helix domain-containing protein n=1 Tax=Leeuwenhoekiella nanhaiensis TaxID=1655491 RepID=A0A2G1VPV3_9FLAO|nr:helix-turn-helix domain-containing protein [Leeuwenhoekiella nanhaiensis]PHQ28795.1 hypothetical protein CJ305_13335 [Leeuwenhoekiella nanhaiensis]
MKTTTIVTTEISIDELIELISDKLIDKIEHYLKDVNKSQNDLLLTRKEIAKYLRVSITTIHHWMEYEILDPIRIGNRVYFKKQDILDLVEERKHSNLTRLKRP